MSVCLCVEEWKKEEKENERKRGRQERNGEKGGGVLDRLSALHLFFFLLFFSFLIKAKV
jgi:hypothetical protein